MRLFNFSLALFLMAVMFPGCVAYPSHYAGHYSYRTYDRPHSATYYRHGGVSVVPRTYSHYNSHHHRSQGKVVQKRVVVYRPKVVVHKRVAKRVAKKVYKKKAYKKKSSKRKKGYKKSNKRR